MKLIKTAEGKYPAQPDPYIVKSEDGKYYIYVTGADGVHAFRADCLLGEYEDIGIVFNMPGRKEYWAPSVAFIDGKYYMYVSCMAEDGSEFQAMHVASSDVPEGPFGDAKKLLPPFSIDSHIVKNSNGLFLFYSIDDTEAERAGTYIVVDRLLDPYTLQGNPKTVARATMDQEIFRRDETGAGKHWHTIEGAFYFREGDWHYVIYSGGCYMGEYYFLGYSRAKSESDDLMALQFEKYPDEKTYCPLIEKNEFEEGTGHNSVIKEDGQWYVVYHGRDKGESAYGVENRTARICKMYADDGVLRVERHKDSI